jgi:hypothetical protein
MDAAGPSDAELLEAGGWAGVDGACVLARGWDGDFCAAVVNTHHGDESSPYHTIIECFDRGGDGRWRSLGHHGPVSRGQGSGSYDGRWNYEYGWSHTDESWWVVALDEQ